MKKTKSSMELAGLLDIPETVLLNTLRILLEKNKIGINSYHEYKRIET